MRSIILAVALAGCANSNSGVDASPLIDAAPPEVDADPRCPIVINEVAAAGDPDDWFELVNRSAATVDLTGYRFVDEADDLDAAVALDITVLGPGARLVQEVTDADQGFQLGADDALVLFRGSERCDEVDWGSGDSPAGGSYARTPDGAGDFETAEPDTRGIPN